MDIDDYKSQILLARAKMQSSRTALELAALDYRRTVRDAVKLWQGNGLSLRKCADHIGITEGALRELLRPDGKPRRYKSKETKPDAK